MGQNPCTLVNFKIAGQLPFVTQIFGPEVLTWTHTQGSLCISKGDPLYLRENLFSRSFDLCVSMKQFFIKLIRT